MPFRVTWRTATPSAPAPSPSGVHGMPGAAGHGMSWHGIDAPPSSARRWGLYCPPITRVKLPTQTVGDCVGTFAQRGATGRIAKSRKCLKPFYFGPLRFRASGFESRWGRHHSMMLAPQPAPPPAASAAPVDHRLCRSAPPLPRNEAPGVVRTSGALSLGLSENPLDEEWPNCLRESGDVQRDCIWASGGAEC